MKVYLERQSSLHLTAHNTEGNTIQVDGASKFGGQGKGMRPMEMLLTSLAACSSMDLIALLTKNKLEPRSLRIEVEGERKEEKTVTPFHSIHLHYFVEGIDDHDKVEQFTKLAVEKYCSVGSSLSSDINISYEVTHE